MEITGRIITVMPATGGVSSSGNEWKKQEYILETIEQYPKKVCFQLFGNNRIDQAAIKQGEEVTVSFDIESREFNGKWYTNINAWKVDRRTNGQPAMPGPSAQPYQPVPQTAAAPYTPTGSSSADSAGIPAFPPPGADDDLPF